jgi:mannitol-1-/sugar-/sorbitol-6-/2-deoxyglucose-6-phosphatase
MHVNTVIFDMDGVLIDSEPYWEEAGSETMAEFGIVLTADQYNTTTGLRTREWIDFWFSYFHLDKRDAQTAENMIVTKAMDKIRDHANPMPGVDYILEFFSERNFTIGLATSSPMELIEVVVRKLKIKKFLKAFSSAEELLHSKPHPEVYLNCANNLSVSPLQCLCFEDSFNGMIAAKAARMKCAIVPAPPQFDHAKWGSADVKIASLAHFDDSILNSLCSTRETVPKG